MTLINHEGAVIRQLSDSTPVFLILEILEDEAHRLGVMPADMEVVYEPVVIRRTGQFLNVRTLEGDAHG